MYLRKPGGRRRPPSPVTESPNTEAGEGELSSATLPLLGRGLKQLTGTGLIGWLRQFVLVRRDYERDDTWKLLLPRREPGGG